MKLSPAEVQELTILLSSATGLSPVLASLQERLERQCAYENTNIVDHAPHKSPLQEDFGATMMQAQVPIGKHDWCMYCSITIDLKYMQSLLERL